MRLERSLAALVVTKIEEQLLHSGGESLILWVIVELITDELEFIGNAIGVATIFVTEKEVALVIERVPCISGGILHNVPLLLEAAADISIHVFEPSLQLRVGIGIAIYLVDGVDEVISG